MNFSGLGSLMKNAGKIQEMMKKNQEELANLVVTGEAGGGDVKANVTAKNYVKNIVIADHIWNEDKAIVQELIVAAMNDAAQKVEEATKEKMSGLGDMFGIDLPDGMV